MKAHVVDRRGKSLGLVTLSTNTNNKGRREEQVMFGSQAVDEVMSSLEREYPAPQPRMLMAARFISNALRDSKERDEALEGDIVVEYLHHYGTGALRKQE